MKKIDGKFEPSKTEIAGAQAHARRIAAGKPYDGTIEVLFSRYKGEFLFLENDGYNNYTEFKDDEYLFCGSADCRRY